MTSLSFLFLLISARNGSPPERGGAGDLGADPEVLEGVEILGIGGGGGAFVLGNGGGGGAAIPGNGGGKGALVLGNGGGGGAAIEGNGGGGGEAMLGAGGESSNDEVDVIDDDLRCVDFFGLFGGIFGTSVLGNGGAAFGIGGANDPGGGGGGT